MKSRVLAGVAALLVAACLPACLFRARPDRTRYYTLAADADAPVQLASGLTVGVLVGAALLAGLGAGA